MDSSDREDVVELNYARECKKARPVLASVALGCVVASLAGFAAALAGFDGGSDIVWIGVLLLPVVAFVGAVLGFVAWLRARRDVSSAGEKGLAVAAVCLGGIATAVLFSMVVPVYVGYREGAMKVRALYNLRSVGRAVGAYHSAHTTTPDDLRTLVTTGYISRNELLDPARGNRTLGCDFHYVVGLTPNDPPDWIMAYSDPSYRGGDDGLVLLKDANAFSLREPEFSQRLREFREQFEAARGEPPVIVPPD